MILSKPIVGKIVRGEITHVLRTGNTRAPELNARLFVKSGQSEPIACHIVVQEVMVRRAGEVDYDLARKLGHRTTDAFRAAWVLAHDTAWAVGVDDDMLEAAALVRFHVRHLDRRVFIVRFEVDRTERPRLLADRNARTDYVESPALALSHEPEAVDVRTQDKFSLEGHQGWVAREGQRELDRELLMSEDRMRLVRIEARAQGVDISQIEMVIRQRLREAERKIHRKRAA